MKNSTQSTPIEVAAPVGDVQARLLTWVGNIAELTQPDQIHWVDGSAAEYSRLPEELVKAGTLVRLNEELSPNSFAAFSDPKDVARVEDQTFICSEHEHDAGFTNNWMDPTRMKKIPNQPREPGFSHRCGFPLSLRHNKSGTAKPHGPGMEGGNAR